MAIERVLYDGKELERPGGSWSQKRIVQYFSNLAQGTLVLSFDDGSVERCSGSQPGPEAEIRIHSPLAFVRSVALGGDLGFGESYMRDEWSSPDPAALLYLLSMNLEQLQTVPRRSLPVRLLARLQHGLRRNSLRGSRRNIASHYDLGNAFYSRWLDASMSYSSAVYDQSEDLFAAQQRKYELLFDQIDPQPGEHILEIGCGWGGFAEHAARWGMRVTGITLSREQYEYARERVRKAGLEDRVEILLCDYRDLEGQFDHVVSIEMFEAVGRSYWQRYFDVVARCLRPGGRAAFQIITIREELFEDYVRDAGGFIQKYIFPGGMLPSESHLFRHACAAGLTPLGMERYGDHYADTLADWGRVFGAETSWLDANGYDRRFRRMWGYYLAFCEAGFRDGRIDLVQFCVAREETCAA